MTDQIDVLGRKAAADLERATSSDPALGLPRVMEGEARSRLNGRLLVAAAIVGVLLAGWLGRATLSADTAPPAHKSGPPLLPVLCYQSGIKCQRPHTFRFDLVDPVRWHIRPGYGVGDGASPTATRVESFWKGGGATSGVSVLELVRPAGRDGRIAPGQEIGVSARDFVQWLAARPFVSAGPVTRTTVGGRTAWHVRVRLARGAGPGTETCAGSFRCHPVTVSDQATTTAKEGGGMTGIWADMVADYTFLDLPSGTAVVWSWAFGDARSALARNHSLVDGISWPAD